MVCDRLSALGVSLDPHSNHSSINKTALISDERSMVKVLVIPTNEELEIARQAAAVLNNSAAPRGGISTQRPP
jgi:acetate kinase